MAINSTVNFQTLCRAVIVGITLFLNLPSKSQQTSADLEFRFNPVYSRGFREPLFANDAAGFFTMQRTRLILNYNNPDSLKAQIILQDRRAWGEVSERRDVAELAIFRAWIEQNLTEDVSIKLGRQGLVYDDQHLLGELNWGGTLAHDVALTKYNRGNFEAHLGLAFNANRVNELKRDLYQPNFYKNMQFLWMHQDHGKLSSSFILINRGLERSDTTVNYTQTFGTNTSLSVSKNLTLKGIYYHQLGRDVEDRKVDANFWSVQLLYKPNTTFDFTIGLESTSGTNEDLFSDSTRQESNSFDILYGLLHGHYGYIDYFYVLIDPIFGIRDYYLKSNIRINKQWKIRNNLHLFTTQAQAFEAGDTFFQNPLENYLGIENDFILSYAPTKTFKASFGHSIMFGSNTLEAMFGGQTIKESQVFYMVITATPRIFKNK